MLPFIVLAFVLTVQLTYTLDPDFGWHLYLGRLIFSNHHLVHTLPGYSVFSQERLADHEWLSHWILGLIYPVIGYGGLIILSFLTLITTVAIAWKLAQQKKVSSTHFLLTSTLYGLTLSNSYNVRLQTMLPLGAILLLWGCETLPLAKRRLFYFFLFLIGTNLHGGFLVLLAIPGILEFPLSKQAVKDYVFTMLSCLAGIAINPYGLSFWQLVLDYARDPYYKQHINEWFPIYSAQGVSLITLGFPMIWMVFLSLASRIWSWIELRLGIVLALFLTLTILHVRFDPVFSILALPTLTEAFSRSIPENSPGWNGVRKFCQVSFSFAVLFFVSGLDFDHIQIKQNPQNRQDYPDQAMAVVAANPTCTGHLFNSYAWGGYILGFYPQETVFIDGRAPQQPLPNHTTLLKNYRYILHSPNPNAQLSQYGMNCVLMGKSIQHLADEGELIDHIKQDPQWELAFQDAHSALYVRVPKN